MRLSSPTQASGFSPQMYNKVWEALLKLVEEKKGSYDHIVITGVNHDDTMEAVDRILK